VQNREELCDSPIEVNNNLNNDKKDLNHRHKIKRKPYFMEALEKQRLGDLTICFGKIQFNLSI
jgi:hypothetical protein